MSRRVKQALLCLALFSLSWRPRNCAPQRRTSPSCCLSGECFPADECFRGWCPRSFRSEDKCAEYASRATSSRTSVFLVYGGEDSLVNEFPHMAALGYRSRNGGSPLEWLCGGSLISEYFVLTAAHCVARRRPAVVRLGEHDLRRGNDGARPRDYEVSKIAVHPKYESEKLYYDIALVKLSRRVAFRRDIRPACLDAFGGEPGDIVTATGWGKIDFFDSAPVLQKVDLKVYDASVCRRFYPASSFRKFLPCGVVSSQICAGDLDVGKDTCEGDSGGPLQVKIGDYPEMYGIIGVTSFGVPCGNNRTAAVYTRVASFLPWIERVVWS